MTFPTEKAAGLFLVKGKQYDAAFPHLAKALEADPMDTEVLTNLAVCKANQGELETADQLCQRVLQLDPTAHKAYHLASAIAAFAGQHDRAEALVDRALSIAPNMPSAMWNKSHLELMRGDYKNGFEHFRWGRVAKINTARAYGKEWDGSKTGTLFVWCEQGQGDVFQMLRYVPEVCKRADRVILEVYKPQLGLVDFQGFPCEVVAQPEDWHNPYAYDCHVGMMDLPRLCGVETPADVDGSAYLKAPESRKSQSKVGICWKGSPTHENDAQRSIPEEELAPLRRFQLASLQHGETLEGWEQVHLGDYEATASVLAGLDLLITVDTSVAHLAGALGVPTWMIAPMNGEWRWGKEGEKTCWYDSMRVLRPDMENGFTKVVAQVAEELNGTKQSSAELFQRHGERVQDIPVQEFVGGGPADLQLDACRNGRQVPHPDDAVPQL